MTRKYIDKLFIFYIVYLYIMPLKIFQEISLRKDTGSQTIVAEKMTKKTGIRTSLRVH